jgi:hypothetical protein
MAQILDLAIFFLNFWIPNSISTRASITVTLTRDIHAAFSIFNAVT